jgi:hypothetical protein
MQKRRLLLKEKQKMIKHLGKHSDRKVAIMFREVPDEEHMCLVVYPMNMQSQLSNDFMKALESVECQQAESLGDAMHSKMFSDGTAILQRCHQERWIKKVKTADIVVTATPTSNVRLDELNNILNEMKQGEDAIKRMAQLDADGGYTGKVRPRDEFGREVGGPVNIAPGSLNASSNKQLNEAAGGAPVNPASAAMTQPTFAAQQAMAAPQSGALSDDVIANNMKAQADRMAAEAQSMLAESQRMQAEASAMMGVPATPVKKKRGRPAKAKA